MSAEINEYGQPIGAALPQWLDRPLPGNVTLKGEFCRLEPLNAIIHADDLYNSYAEAPDARDWTYLPIGPFSDRVEYTAYAESAANSADAKHYAVIDLALRKAIGTLALLRADAKNSSIEVGWVMFSPLLKRTRISTEAHFLLMRYVFDELGYRRYEWKCDSLNEASCRAARRLGFSFEGIFRQAAIYRQRSRDTAWFSVIDKEWPHIREKFLAWLSHKNFTNEGRQVKALSELMINY
ncbi:GNAT family N-acetyltransferase [Xanthomonas euvesicatoria]|uniref:GNAT family N-acetyltransferase n=1 Tax=Xanthomonas euvesicatoria TaxID=456327 RepID=UPI001C491FE1|nr:GNAT family protein [Xanthomonas euvesicatoria]MBV6885462.1 GNAT family N-acetyltransferase [Xanthomonas campestris pv. euphorbiae]